MGDVRLKQHISEVLAAYHSFWLRLGLEIVVGKAVPCTDGCASRLHRSRAELEAFAREHFLNDADLALQRAGNRALGTLHGDAYWVHKILTYPCSMHMKSCCLAGGGARASKRTEYMSHGLDSAALDMLHHEKGATAAAQRMEINSY